MVKRTGASFVGGMERRRVVEVPRDTMASPGLDKATTVAGLSPVNGAIRQSVHRHIRKAVISNVEGPRTWVEAVTLDPPAVDLAENSTSGNWLRADLGRKLGTTAHLQQLLVPFAADDVHEVHTAGVRNLNRSDRANEDGGHEGRNEGNAGSRSIGLGVEATKLDRVCQRMRDIQKLLSAHLVDLVSGKTLVSTATSDVSEDLGTANRLLELLAFARGRGILPDGAALESESGGRELINKALGGVEGG